MNGMMIRQCSCRPHKARQPLYLSQVFCKGSCRLIELRLIDSGYVWLRRAHEQMLLEDVEAESLQPARSGRSSVRDDGGRQRLNHSSIYDVSKKYT
jgi:hypothetical protein